MSLWVHITYATPLENTFVLWSIKKYTKLQYDFDFKYFVRHPYLSPPLSYPSHNPFIFQYVFVCVPVIVYVRECQRVCESRFYIRLLRKHSDVKTKIYKQISRQLKILAGSNGD